MDSRYVEPAKELRGHATLEDDRQYDDEARGREHGLTGLRHRVPDRQGKTHGATKTREEQHVLEIHGDLGLATEVQQERERIYVRCSAEQCEELIGGY